ncbi:peptidase S8/S53 domain-containing protein [Aspergillus coremiiformis]|uniref:Peptidase S8/S53 domain-containing protein n=1 Tax=Aspergillus coremiiformis TaxID=138285 RepID=A0A5N6YSN9_9EURO|nr:peptidase S8/S53 domain-containing protein [Aspergillus coremiiformis]
MQTLYRYCEDVFRKVITKNPKIHECIKPGKLEGACCMIFVKDKFAKYIREYCMLESSREDIMKCLYQVGVKGAIFKWLRNQGVEQIVKVMVIDNEHPHYADSTIEEALKGFDVQIWDWKKVDLCSDTIYKSSSVLETVNLFMRWENDTDARLESNRDAFIEVLGKVELLNGQRLNVNANRDNMAVGCVSGFSDMRGFSERNPPWISCLEEFALFLCNAPKAAPVKIAIIDDGVDASYLNLHTKIAGGQRAYFAPLGRHGTWMASLISKLCPRPSLYIARLDEHPADGNRQITAKSAAKAVSWAVACKVDIISISWTIESSTADSQDIDALSDAIKSADDKGIVVICAASDQGVNSTETCYPARAGHCIKIGGANSSGRPLTWVRDDRVEFLFPGQAIPFETPGTASVTCESGSSIATVVVSGLAGLLLYGSCLLDSHHDSLFFRNMQNMKSAFRALAKDKEKRVLDVESFFSVKFQNLLVKKGNWTQAEKHAKYQSTVVKDTAWDPKSQGVLAELLNELQGK